MTGNHERRPAVDGAMLRLDRADNASGGPVRQPETPEEALAYLDAGSRAFAELGTKAIDLRLSPEALGIGPEDNGGILVQEPFAAVLSCSDARVPIEFALGQAANELFVVRVAGNAPGSECRGSLHYAAQHLPSVQIFAVIGHSRCGATTAAVDAMLRPENYLDIATDGPLREIIDPLLAGVTFAHRALLDAHGPEVVSSPDYRGHLITLSTLANTALSALVIEHDLNRACAFGVYKLSARQVGVRRRDGWNAGFAMAPKDGREIEKLVREAAESLIA
ncbi:carbonic anhydrase [[Mycobacterium] kokjensenii]|uniref:Carbonic anhydrase n=1 Tax=[Mycobacterium] kokjensenii TaxID=3064287 RepID=A0ABN9N6L5_9MYCO|nr:carbonic anhydrase [Mycolicibacter sp. MU0083]CAJ1498392.1 carbonic anhydrase [Mycolicibacter sp. MU0083]